MPTKNAEYNRNYRRRHPERARAANKKYAERYPERRRASRLQWESKHPGYVRKQWREWKLRRAYGIGVVEYERLFMLQGGLCAICGRADLKFRLAVDHDHVSNSVRGLLCSCCNQGIGHFRDDPALLNAAASYLEDQREFPAFRLLGACRS